MTRRLLIAPLLSAALLVAACGGTHEADRQDVEKAVKGVYNALADKDAKKVCASISEKGRKDIEAAAARGGSKKQSCEEVFNIALAYGGSALNEAKDVDVTDVKIDGDQAKATVSLQNRKSQVTLVKEDGAWKLGGLDLAGG
jgi:predicted small secreted protein